MCIGPVSLPIDIVACLDNWAILKKSVLLHKFSIDGKYLKENGMKEGLLMGKVLKKIEEEWVKNNFQITKERVKEIIHLQSN